jgi:hypothetical protein
VSLGTGKQQAQLEAFKKRAEEHSVCAEFDSVPDLKTKAMQSLGVIRLRRIAPATGATRLAADGDREWSDDCCRSSRRAPPL